MALCALYEISILSLFINILALTRIVKHSKYKTKISESYTYHNLKCFFFLKIDVHRGLDLELFKVSDCEVKIVFWNCRGRKHFFSFTF